MIYHVPTLVEHLLLSETTTQFGQDVEAAFDEVKAARKLLEEAEHDLHFWVDRLQHLRSRASAERIAQDALDNHSERDLTQDEYDELVEAISRSFCE